MYIIRVLLLATTVVLTNSYPTAATSYTTGGRIQQHGNYLSVEVSHGWPTAEVPDIHLPCNNGHLCYLGPSVTMINPWGNRTYYPAADGLSVTYAPGELLSAVRDRFIRKNGANGVHTIGRWYDVASLPYVSTALACFQYWPNFATSVYTVGVNVPNTVCSTPSPPNVSCDSIPSMVFDFGTVTAGRTDNLRLRQQRTLACSNATSVTLKLLSTIVLSRTMTANLTVNGHALGPAGLTLAATTSSVPLDFVVTTAGTENTGGSYNASSVMLMEYN